MVKGLENYWIAKIGTRTFAVAVLEAMFVTDTEKIDGQMFRELLDCQYWISTIGVLDSMFVMDTETLMVKCLKNY